MKTNVIYKLGNTFASIVGVHKIYVNDVGKLIDDLRMISNKVSLQAVNADYIYGVEHILEVLKITIESEKRNIKVTNKTEMDFLLRLLCTDQISHALRKGGLKNNAHGCFIIFSKDKKQLLKVRDCILGMFKVNNSVLKHSKVKRKVISDHLGLATSKVLFEDVDFLRYLSERASLITK